MGGSLYVPVDESKRIKKAWEKEEEEKKIVERFSFFLPFVSHAVEWKRRKL